MLLSHLAAFKHSSLSPRFSQLQSKRIATYRFNDTDRDSDGQPLVLSFQIQHKGLSFVERHTLLFRKLQSHFTDSLTFQGTKPPMQ